MINITNPNSGDGLAFRLSELNQHFLFGKKKTNMTSENEYSLPWAENPENKATTTGLIFTSYTWSRCHVLTGLPVFIQIP